MAGKMYQLAVSWDEDILAITITGQLIKGNAAQTATEIEQEVYEIISRENYPRLLVDCRTLQGRLGIGETYFHTRKREQLLRVKTAVVDVVGNESYYSFHETTAANAGFLIKYFNDYDAAKAWLRQ